MCKMMSRQIEDFCSNDTSSSSSSLVNDDWLVFEVLTRLPVKTLFRFKSVCKTWCFLIQKDQQFIDLHLLNRSRLTRLFIFNPFVPHKTVRYKVYQEMYITADLMLFEDANKGGDTTTATNVVPVDTVREVDSVHYDSITKPVHGLICLIETNFKDVVRICNISTGELSPSFESSLLSGERNGIPCCRMKNYRSVTPNYQFGFDPSTNEHKLVCLWDLNCKEFKHCLICEVWTVGRQGINGDNRWRRIEEVLNVPEGGVCGDSVYMNGVIYWTSSELYLRHWKSEDRPILIVAFDVGREKFRNISVSDFILDQPFGSSSYTLQYGGVNLLEVSGRLALLVQMNNCTFKMYIYEDDDYKSEDEINSTPIGSGGSFSGINNGRWSEACSITLPFNLGESSIVRFFKFVGSDDEIILTLSEGWACVEGLGKKKCVSFYSYNWKKGSWREFEVSRVPSPVTHLCTRSVVTTFSESLLPINNDKDLF